MTFTFYLFPIFSFMALFGFNVCLLISMTVTDVVLFVILIITFKFMDNGVFSKFEINRNVA